MKTKTTFRFTADTPFMTGRPRKIAEDALAVAGRGWTSEPTPKDAALWIEHKLHAAGFPEFKGQIRVEEVPEKTETIRVEYAGAAADRVGQWACLTYPPAPSDSLRRDILALIGWYREDEAQLAAMGHAHDDQAILDAASELDEAGSTGSAQAVLALHNAHAETIAALRAALAKAEDIS